MRPSNPQPYVWQKNTTTEIGTNTKLRSVVRSIALADGTITVDLPEEAQA